MSNIRRSLLALAGMMFVAGALLARPGAFLSAEGISTTIPASGQPHRVAVNTMTNRIYVTQAQQGGGVLVINGATNALLSTVPLPPGPNGEQPEPQQLAVDEQANRVYVVTGYHLAVIDGAANAVVGSVPLNRGGSPIPVAVNPQTRRAYVGLLSSDVVLVFDTTNTTPVPLAAISGVSSPVRLAVHHATNRIYAVNYAGNSVTALDGATNAVLGSPIAVGSIPHDIAIDHERNRAYVSNTNNNPAIAPPTTNTNTVSVIDLATHAVTANIPVGNHPGGVAVNPARNRIYAANVASNSMSVIDGGTGMVVSTIDLGSGAAPAGVASNPATDRTYVATSGSVVVTAPTANLGVTVSDAPDPVRIGNDLTYIITVSNAGPDAASGVRVVGQLPTAATFVSASAGCAYASGNHRVTCDVGALPNTASRVLSIVARPTAGGSVVNTVTVTGVETDPSNANNAATTSTAVIAADLQLTMTDSPDPVGVRQNLTYTLTVVNLGPTVATNVTVTDALPSGVTFISATGSSGVVCSGTLTVTCTLAALSAFADAMITIVVQPTAQGTLSNSATASASEPDPNPANNTASQTTSVTSPGQSAGLKVTLQVQGKGSVSVAPLGLQCSNTCQATTGAGTQLSLSAVEDSTSDYRFDHWEGACSGSTAPVCALTVIADIAIRAVFVRTR